jgi:Tol biopolymer transport system component
VYAAQPSQDSIAVVDTASLMQTSSIPTGTSTCPLSLSLLGARLWFGYGCLAGKGAIGSADLSAPTPTVSLGASGSAYYYRQPALISSSNDPGTLFAADAGESPSRVDAYTVSDAALAPLATLPAAPPVQAVSDMQISPDGQELLLAAANHEVLNYSTADLSPTGSITTSTNPATAAPAGLSFAPDGSLAVGIWGAQMQPLVYVYAPDGSFRYQYISSPAVENALAAGLAYNAAGTAIYAVTTAAGDGSQLVLHVLTGLADTARPPAPLGIGTNPLYRAVRIVWAVSGLFPYGPPTAYTVYRGTSPTALTALATVPGQVPSGYDVTDLSYDDFSAAAGVTYYYAVTASNSSGESDRTAILSGVRDEHAYVYTVDPPTTMIISSAEHGNNYAVPSVPDDYATPVFSPDGTRIAYSLASETAAHIGRIASDGSDQVLLTSGTASDTQPAWSPDGQTIAFTRTTASGSSIWTVPASGGTPTRVPGTSGDSDPAWSPSRKQLAVVSAAHAIKVLTLADGYERTVVTSTAPAYLRSPGFSPDGNSLVYVVATPGPAGASWAWGTLKVVPAAGGPQTDLTTSTPAANTVQSAYWSPDGTGVLFSDEYGELHLLTSAKVEAAQAAGTTSAGPFPVSVPAGRGSYYAPRVAYVATPPAKVSALAASLASRSVTLSWTKPSDAAYVVVRRSAAGGSAPASPSAGVAVYAGTGTSVVAAGLTNGAQYRFSVFAMSAGADASGADTVTASPASTPKVSPNGSVLGALVGSGPSFTASWGPAPPTGQTYEVQLGQRVLNKTTNRWSAPVFQPWLPSTRATHATIKAAAGTTYYVRARVHDSFGHVTSWSARATAAVPYDDRAFSTGTGWSRTTAAGTFASTLTTSLRADATASISVSASAVSLVADKCSHCGAFSVEVDGIPRGKFATYSATLQHRKLVWSYKFAGIGKHKVTVTAVGTPGQPQVRIDGLLAVR